MAQPIYNDLPALIPQHLIERAAALDTAQICDGLKGLAVQRDGCMDADVMPVTPGMRVIGTAYTVATQDGDNFPLHVAIYQGKPGYVLVIDGKGYTQSPYMGDLMVSAAKAVGLEGIVIDGYIRDKEPIAAMDYPVFSKGYMQRGPKKQDPGQINTIITCAGVSVAPGDLVIGDYDGVTVVPRDKIEAALTAAEKKNSYENERRKTIDEYARCRAEGKPLPAIAPGWVTEMLAELAKQK